MNMATGFEFDSKSIRISLGMTQKEFWERIGVAQSCGSRYESGRRMPKPVIELLRIVHVEGIELAKINAGDTVILKLLREREPETFQWLASIASEQLDSRQEQARPCLRRVARTPESANARPSTGLPVLELIASWSRSRSGEQGA